MKLLLDTCSFLWITTLPRRLSPSAIEAIRHPDNIVFLSVSSIWEIAIKYKAGRLDLPSSPARFIPECLGLYELRTLDIGHSHVISAGDLPLHHHDPFDRLLIAQARIEGLAIATPDEAFATYDVELLW